MRRQKKAWLNRVASMVNIPSHDTFNRIFQAIKPEHFGNFLIEMTNRLRKKIRGEIIAFDGKTHCGTGDGLGTGLHMLIDFSVYI